MDKAPFELGCLNNPIDYRDYIAESMLPTEVPLPKKVDLRPYLPPVFDQGSQGACSAVTAGTQKECLEYFDAKYKGRMSYQFIYNNRSNSSSGMYPRETMDILVKKGCVIEDEYKYGSNTKITKALLDKALNFTNKSYAEVHTVEGAKKSLYLASKGTGSPIYISLPVYNYGARFWFKTADAKVIGGHAVTIVGYDDSRQSFLVRNSWGNNWVNEGYTWMSYTDFENCKQVAYSVLDVNSKKLTFLDNLKLFFLKIRNWLVANPYLLAFIGMTVIFLIIGLSTKK
jgi:C1A family cysteine protease